jgi:hypothetical protein
MIDVYHCPKCSRLLKCEGVIAFLGDELPVFQCEDCIVKRAIFGPGTDEIEMAYTFCVDAAGRCFDPTEHMDRRDDGPDTDDDPDLDPTLN